MPDIWQGILWGGTTASTLGLMSSSFLERNPHLPQSEDRVLVRTHTVFCSHVPLASLQRQRFPLEAPLRSGSPLLGCGEEETLYVGRQGIQIETLLQS